jgi:hypothetical protein
MKFSEHWLRTLCNPPLTRDALCETLTMAGLEVEEVDAASALHGRVVATIEAVARHPNADRLSVCTVDAGARSCRSSAVHRMRRRAARAVRGRRRAPLGGLAIGRARRCAASSARMPARGSSGFRGCK